MQIFELTLDVDDGVIQHKERVLTVANSLDEAIIQASRTLVDIYDRSALCITTVANKLHSIDQPHTWVLDSGGDNQDEKAKGNQA